MDRLRFRLTVVAVLALLSGCRLPFSRGPVSESLGSCRRLSQQGIAAAERGRFEQAETLLAQAVEACPVDSEARRHYAETLWRRGQRQAAIVQLEEAARLATDDATLQVRLAEMYFQQRQMRQAWRNTQQALDLDPRSPAAWAIRGRLMRAGGHLQQALADNHRALAYAPGNPHIVLEVAELHRQLNRPERALVVLQSLAESYSPGEVPPEVLGLTAQAYSALGRHEDAAESLFVIAQESPNEENLHHLAEAQWRAGRAGEAAATARRALALGPQYQPAHELLQRIEMTQRPPPFLQR